MACTARRTYDPTLKQLIATSQNAYLLSDLKIARTTAQHWIHKRRTTLVTSEHVHIAKDELYLQLQNERKRLAEVSAKLFVLQALVDVSAMKLDWHRLPDAEAKRKVLRTIDTARVHLPLRECVKLIGISTARYYEWKSREKGCELADYSSCPRVRPTGVTHEEISKIHDLVMSKEHAHFSIRNLALYAMRKGIAYATDHTWWRLIKSRGWDRSRKRVYPKRNRIGVRAVKPNQIWHIDVTVLKLTDRTRAYLQAIIDNFSRYVLAWNVSIGISGIATRELLRTALKRANVNETVDVWTDGGPENDNNEIRKFAHLAPLKLTLAQIDVDRSNSLIECFFRTLKNRYLYFQHLDTVESLRKFTDYYINQHNNEMPYHAFGGATPAEQYFGKWSIEQKEELAKNRVAARKARLEFNRNLRCRVCSGDTSEMSSIVGRR